jgi:AcrR family transcriptional regulator
MAAPKLNKHALRTKETREQLLRSAEVVFVRDGYESADLAEIAEMAGRTRGAIYAQFKSKEDVFLALIEEKTRDYRAQMEKLLVGSTNTEQNLKAYRQFCISMIEDPVWGLLLLEFKLYAMRHPESKERIQKYFDEIFSKDQEKKLADLLGVAGRDKDALSRSVAVRLVQPLLSAIAIEASFSPTVLDKETLKKVATRTFDALMHAPSK